MENDLRFSKENDNRSSYPEHLERRTHRQRIVNPHRETPLYNSSNSQDREKHRSFDFNNRENGYSRKRNSYQSSYQPSDHHYRESYNSDHFNSQNDSRYASQESYKPRSRYGQPCYGTNNQRDDYPQEGYKSYKNNHKTIGRGGYNRSDRFQRGQYKPHSYRQHTADYDPSTKYNFQKVLRYKEENIDPTVPIRLNRFLANAGVCSRREADQHIADGLVSVNGTVITELGHKVLRTDNVTYKGNPISLEDKVYILLNKPKDCVTTSDDPEGRKTVMDIVKGACSERVYPVGRLDRNTTGVLLLTNDGEMAAKMMHPQFMKKKIYHVYCNKQVSFADMQKILEGIILEDGEIHADRIEYASEVDRKQIGIEIHSGKNRIVRRIFENLGYRVVKLDRVYFAGLTKKNLRRGHWRFLEETEVNMLRMGAYE